MCHNISVAMHSKIPIDKRHFVVAFIGLTLLSAGFSQQKMPDATRKKLDYVADRIQDQSVIAADYYWHKGVHHWMMGMLFFLIELDPKDVELYSGLGWILDSNDMPDRALEVYERGIKANPTKFDNYYDAGFFHYQKKNYEKAADYARQAVSKGAPAVVYKLLAHSYEKMKNYEKALEVWEQIRKLTPDDVAIDHNVKKLKALMTGGSR